MGDDLSNGLNTLGPLCLWQCFMYEKYHFVLLPFVGGLPQFQLILGDTSNPDSEQMYLVLYEKRKKNPNVKTYLPCQRFHLFRLVLTDCIPDNVETNHLGQA